MFPINNLKKIFSKLRYMKSVLLSVFWFVMIVVSSFSLVACGGDNDESAPKDTQSPIIEIDTPSDGVTFVRGINEIIISGSITDTQVLDVCVVSLSTGLKSIKSTTVDENNNGGEDVITSIDDPEIFTPNNDEISLSGKSFTFKADYSPFGIIPQDAKAGEYVLKISATDAAGNSSSEDITINITNE
jgi:hypothetical protein